MLGLIPLAGLAVGAAGMYFLDPQQGRRRRAVLRDKFASRTRGLGQAAGVAMRDLRHRTRGTAIEMQRWSSMGEGEVPDRVLVERLRAKLGRHVSHSHAIKVQADRGYVTLKGPILAREHNAVMSAARRVRGVRDVQDLLQVHESGEHVSALQGSGALRRDARQETWTPTARVLSGGTGAALLLMGLRHRGVVGTVASAAGALMVTRALSNRPLARMAQDMGMNARSSTARSPSASTASPQPSDPQPGGRQTRADIGAARGWQSPAKPRGAEPGQDGSDDDFSGYPTPSL